MLAPCITVLSTSKNAAAVGSAGVASAVSTSAAAAAASPASVERCWRFSGRAALLGRRSHAASVAPVQRSAGSGRPRCGRIRPCRADCPRCTTWPAARGRRGADAPGPARRRRGRWAQPHLGRARGRGRPDRDRARRGGLVAGQRVMLAMGNRIEFVTTYLGVLRAQVVAVPVNPRADRRRAGADDRRLGLAAGRRRRRHGRDGARGRRPGAGRPRRRDATSWTPTCVARAVEPRVVVVGAEPPAGERSYDALRADARRGRCRRCRTRRSSPACSTRAGRRAGRARRCSPTARCSPTSTRPPQVEPPMIHGDDVVLGVLPLFHVYGLNAVLGGVLRHRAKLVLVEHFEPQGDARPDRGRGVQRRAGRAAGLRATGCAEEHLARAARPGAADAVRLRAARRRSWSSEFTARDRHPGPPGLRPHRGLAGRDQHAVQRRAPAAARSARRCPASRSGWSTRPAARPRATTPARSRSAAPTCSAATGPTAPTAPTTTAGGPPATSASSTRPATCSSSTGSRSW